VDIDAIPGEILVFCVVVALVKEPPDHELRVVGTDAGVGDGFSELFLTGGVFEATSLGRTGGDEFRRALCGTGEIRLSAEVPVLEVIVGLFSPAVSFKDLVLGSFAGRLVPFSVLTFVSRFSLC